MGPVELIFFSIGLTIMLIGLARGYVRELGSTLIILVTIFILTFFEDQTTTVMNTIGTRLLGIESDQSANLLLSSIFTLAFVVIVFTSYAGRTLTFTGQPAPPPQGTVLSVIIGALNGYLIAGTLWYYQHIYDYPIGQFVEFNNDLTERAEILVNYLPQNLFTNPVYWIVPVAVLLIMRVRG